MEVSFSQNKPAKNNFVKRSTWLFLAKLLPTLSFLIITILYSRQLSFHSYGTFQTVWMLTNVSVVLLGFGMYSVVLSSGIKSTIQLLKKNRWKFTGLYFLLLGVAALFIRSSLPHQPALFSILVLSVIIIHTLSFIYESILLRSGNEISIFMNNLLYSVLYFIWHIYILSTKFEIVYLFTGLAALGVLRLLIYIILAKTAMEYKTTGSISLLHWFFIGLNEVINVIAKWIDKLLLVYFFTPSEFAIFFNGSIEIPLFGIMISVVGSLLLVEISANLTKKEKVIQMFRETFILLSNIVFPLFWFLFFFGGEIFNVVFNNRYDDSIPIFILAIFIIPVRVTNYTSILQCYNKARIIVKGSLLDILIAMVLMPLLYFMIGIKGVALAVVLSTYVQSIYYLHHSAKALQTTMKALVPLKYLVFRFLIFAVIIGISSYLLQNKNDMETLLYSFLFVSFIIVYSLFFYFKKEKMLLLNNIKS